MSKSLALLTACSLLFAAGTASAASCRYSKPVKAFVNGAGLKTLTLKLGSADLNLRGVAGLANVEVTGKACAASKDALARMRLVATRSGDAGSITAEENGDAHGFFNFGGRSMQLQARVPATLATAVRSGSGDVDAEGLAALDFRSGSGDLKARNIAGALGLELGSADVVAQGVGRVDLRATGSGDVTVSDVHGDVHAGQSGSGDLRFTKVAGSVKVDATGSGDVTLGDVAHDVDVGSTGSGDVTVNGAGGNLTVGATGSGAVRYHDVDGKVSVPHNRD